MKKLILLLAFILPMAVYAQKDPVDKLFEKYANKEGFTTVNISGKLLNFASQMETDDEEASKLLSQLNGVRILTAEDEKKTGKLDFYGELDKDGFFKKGDYEVLMEVTEENEIVRFLAKDGGKGKLSDLVLIVSGEENVLISIRGIIDPAEISKITKSMNIDIDSQIKVN